MSLSLPKATLTPHHQFNFVEIVKEFMSNAQLIQPPTLIITNNWILTCKCGTHLSPNTISTIYSQDLIPNREFLQQKWRKYHGLFALLSETTNSTSMHIHCKADTHLDTDKYIPSWATDSIQSPRCSRCNIIHETVTHILLCENEQAYNSHKKALCMYLHGLVTINTSISILEMLEEKLFNLLNIIPCHSKNLLPKTKCCVSIFTA